MTDAHDAPGAAGMERKGRDFEMADRDGLADAETVRVVDAESAEALVRAFDRDLPIGPASLRTLVRHFRRRKDEAYTERNRMVALLASLFPASMERHPDEDTTWEDDWRWVVYIDLPTGQASWHLHDSQLALFGHVPRFQGRRWDGHTTEEKYARVMRLTEAKPTPEKHPDPPA